MDDAKILPAIGVDDHRCLEWRRIVGLPQEEILSITSERDFYELHRCLLVMTVERERALAESNWRGY
jgi:hypothetical protein